ncbi:MAG: indole-3-glycerol phosphate synthase TrpC [Thermodesulfovibrionales bacterium]|nr:indole-3-glycerol phosphate synthase TrpC [Thermodesulfovibrionales bacterium]
MDRTVLDQIKDKKNQRLIEAKRRIPFKEIKARALDTIKPNDFKSAITSNTNEQIRLIAEIKKASPSKGLLSESFNHIEIAKLYQETPVSAVSVLTEEDFFMGSIAIFEEVRKIVKKPILRKDFIFEEYQIYESRAIGADAILLISAMLDKSQSKEYLQLAEELDLSVLYEVHDEYELDNAIEIDASIIGVNNRNLKTLKIDLSTSERLSYMIPKDVIKVSESGIESFSDVLKVKSWGYDAILVGSAITKADNKVAKINELIICKTI